MSAAGVESTNVRRSWATRLLPFADAATAELPLARLLRLSLFQVSVGTAIVLLNGTLNRVMIVELGLPVWLVSVMVSIPIVFAPVRALVGHRSDVYVSALGWRRVPFIWMGTLIQFGGLAIMPFAIIVLSGRTELVPPPWMGPGAAALAFLLVGAGLHTTQTAGLALATDLASEASRPRVVALLYVVFLIGSIASASILGWLLTDFSDVRLIEVIQGSAVVTMVLNGIALWKQEPRRRLEAAPPAPSFAEAWASFSAQERSGRFLVTVSLGTLAFTMQDILLEPFGGEVLALPVGSTTLLTALLSAGMLAAFALAARLLARGADLHRLSATGALIGVVAFVTVLFSAPFQSATAFRCGTFLIGLGGGLFSVGTLTAAMSFRDETGRGLALGAWGAAQATAAGLGVFLGGAIRDVVGGLAANGSLGPALSGQSVGYGAVYELEILLLFATLVALGPLVGSMRREVDGEDVAGLRPIGISEFPR